MPTKPVKLSENKDYLLNKSWEEYIDIVGKFNVYMFIVKDLQDPI